jgi:hypothetical protein
MIRHDGVKTDKSVPKEATTSFTLALVKFTSQLGINLASMPNFSVKNKSRKFILLKHAYSTRRKSSVLLLSKDS